MPLSQELLDILACPMCKKDVEYRTEEDFLYCKNDDVRYYKGQMKGEDICPKCGDALEEIKGEVLLCTECKRWYPIIDDIPHMLPDELREDLG
jgi:uncharacterized protein YbaR (Trm112 family)